MAQDLHDLRSLTATAVRRAMISLREQFPNEKLFGLALCTDDEVTSVYHVACTRGWVKEKEQDYPEIGFVYTEWMQSADEALFDPVCASISALADDEYASDSAWSAARDARFEAIVLGLKDCREGGVFDEDTVVCFGSTDPSDHLEALAMSAADRLNSRPLADQFAKHLGYEKHRKRA